MLMDCSTTTATGGGHHHHGPPPPHSMYFRDRKKSCGIRSSLPSSSQPTTSSGAHRLPVFRNIHREPRGPSSVMSESTVSSVSTTPTRSGATTPTQQSYLEECSQMMMMMPSTSSVPPPPQPPPPTLPPSSSSTSSGYFCPSRPSSSFQHFNYRHQNQRHPADEYRKRSNTLLSRGSDKRWPKRDMGPQFELRCCIDPEILRINVDRQYYFEDETVRVNGSVFHKRSDYDNLLSIIPQTKFNGIHIKMEDDCPQGGDDVRLCLLKTLGAHNQRSVSCVQCKEELKVYDKYPLIDGVFYISPVCQTTLKTEISLDGRRFFLQQLCARCLWSEWSCKNCGKDEWFDGKSIILGTLYYYDIVSAGRCCPASCQSCKQPLGVRDQLAAQLSSGNYATINEQMTCTACGSSKFHLVRDIKTVHVASRPIFASE